MACSLLAAAWTVVVRLRERSLKPSYTTLIKLFAT